MRWLKLVAIVVGAMIAFLVVSTVVGFLIEAVIAMLAVGVVILAVKVAFNRKKVSWKRPGIQIRGPRHGRRLRRRNTPDVEDELARLKGEMDS